MRIFVFGFLGCGKFSFVFVLFGLMEYDNRVSCDNGVIIYIWEW